MEKALTTGTMNTDIMVLPDYSGMAESTSMSTIEPERMSPMDSLKAIFEEMRDSLNTLVELAKSQQPSAADMRDQGVADADVVPDGEPDSQGNSSFPEIKMPEVGPKLGLGLMMLGLSALFAYGDEIAAEIAPLLELGDKFLEMLGPTGSLYLGLAGLTAIIFPKTFSALLGAGAKGIKYAFTELGTGFKGMRESLGKYRKNLKKAYTGGKKLIMDGFTKLGKGFQLMRVFLIEKAYPAILSAFGGIKGKVFGAITKLGKAFTAMRLFLMGTMIPTIAGFMAPFIVPLAILVAVVAAAVAIFVSIKAGIDEFKKSLKEGDTMLGAIIEGVSTALLTLVTLPITLIKNFVAWVAKKLGFEGIAEKLKEFSIVDFIKNGIKTLVIKAKDFVLGLFNIDFKKVLGKFVDIGASIGRVLKGIALGSIAAVKAAFPGGESPMEAFKRVYDEVSNKGEDNPKMPEESNPEADGTVKSMEQARKEELKANEAEIEKLEVMDDRGKLLADGSEPLDKIMALESRNLELETKLLENAVIQTDIAKKSLELQETNSGGNVITTVNNTDASNTNNTSTNNTSTAGLAVTGKDSTALALANAGF